jgi:hypothetical protein
VELAETMTLINRSSVACTLLLLRREVTVEIVDTTLRPTTSRSYVLVLEVPILYLYSAFARST